jgi:hypothetical protein
LISRSFALIGSWPGEVGVRSLSGAAELPERESMR